jgi:hypothetical protein
VQQRGQLVRNGLSAVVLAALVKFQRQTGHCASDEPYRSLHRGKVKGGFTITVDYTLDRQLSMIVTAEAKIKAPKKPKASYLA